MTLRRKEKGKKSRRGITA